MRLPFPEVRMWEPMPCEGLAVFPLFAEPSGKSALDYLLSHEAMVAGTLTVQEASEEGSVSELLVENGGDRPVLFVEGEEVCGGKQNRVLCSSVLVGGRSRTTIPVACVERGRWKYESRHFASGSCCPPTLRHVLKQAACRLRSARRSGFALGGDPEEARPARRAVEYRGPVRHVGHAPWQGRRPTAKPALSRRSVGDRRRNRRQGRVGRPLRQACDSPEAVGSFGSGDRRRRLGDLHDQVPNERNGRIGRACIRKWCGGKSRRSAWARRTGRRTTARWRPPWSRTEHCST